jgi:hypothetical protein
MGTLLSKKKSKAETVGNGDTGPPEVKDEAPAAEVAAKEEEVKPAEDTPKVEETAKTEETEKTEETAKAEETPTSGEESKTEEPPKADSPEQQEVAPKLSEEEAATKIQAIVRGKKARDDVKAMKEGGESEPAETYAAAEDATPAPEGEKTDEAAPQEDDEASPEEQEKAAVKIQASFRGIQARKKVDAMKENKDESTKDTPAEAEAEAPSGGDAPTES